MAQSFVTVLKFIILLGFVGLIGATLASAFIPAFNVIPLAFQVLYSSLIPLNWLLPINFLFTTFASILLIEAIILIIKLFKFTKGLLFND